MEEMYNETYFITGGGTGGHIYPALAVADKLAENNAEIYYVGNKTNMECDLASQKGYKFLHVGISGMPRKLSLRFFLWIIQLSKAVFRSIMYIKKYKPKAVFATGGYVSAPMIFACRLTKTPYMMHDCDAMPGLVTRHLSKRARYVSLAFDKAKNFIQNKNTIVTGNPIREGFKTVTKESARIELGLQDKPTVTIFGGSQGAKSINNTVIELLREFSQEFNLQIVFQTGKKNYDEAISRLSQFYPLYAQDNNIIVRPYFDNMVSILKASDIVISRAGSLSLSEICASDVAPILVPYPYAAANHQRANARFMLEKGACVYIEDDELEPNKLKETILELIKNPVKMNYLKQNSSYLAKYDAANEIAQLVQSIGVNE